MRYIRIAGVCLMGTLSMYLLSAVPAFAVEENNPQWRIAGKVLAKGTKEMINVTQNGNQFFHASTFFLGTIKCIKMKSKEAEIFGSTPPNAGTSDEVFVYEECELEGSPKCEINKRTGESKEAKITTVTLEDRLVFSTKQGAKNENAEETDTLFKPKAGTTFLTIELGANCPRMATFVYKGEVLARNLGTPGKEEKTHGLEPIEEGAYFENEVKKTVEHKVGRLMEAAAALLGVSGKVVIELASKQEWSLFN